MAEIQDTFTKLKLAVMGTRTQKIDAKLDQVVKDISAYRSNSGRNGYIDLVKSLISKNANVQISSSSGLFSQGGAGPSSFGQGGRILRYKTYQAIVSNINYCHRALQVLTDNILSPDDITKISLDIKSSDKSNDGEEVPEEAQVRRVKNVIKKIKIEEDLSSIVKNTLMFGDFFCEIGDAITALTSKSLLSEAEYLSAVETSKDRGEIDTFRETIDKKNYTISINYSALNEDTTIQQDDKKSEEMKSLKNLKLIYHEPQFILRLQSSLFPVCFGYLIFPQITVVPGTSIAEDAINNIVLSILKSLEKKIPQMKEFKNNDDLKHIIAQMLAQSEYNKAIEIRYVAPDKMVHFKIPSNKYYPYGESIFDNGQFSAKVLIALETALAIQRLARSTEKRKIAVEVGLPRDAKKVIEKLKEEFRKRKITLDSFGTVDTIPSMITTFEDVYIPQRDGKPFVDISTFNEGNVDVRSKVDELKFIRDQLVAGLGVPPGFIGIEENISAKNTLTEENILFARTIIAHQKYLTHQVQELIEKIFDIISPEEALTLFDTVQVSFPPPKSLQYEREARYMNEVTGLIDGLERVGIPKEYSRKKYLSQIDWDEVSKYETDVKIDQTLDPSKKEDEMDMGGMGGGMGAGF